MVKNIGKTTIDYLKDISEVISGTTASMFRYNKDINIAKKGLTPTISIGKGKIKLDFLFKNFKMSDGSTSATTKVENIECLYKINNDFWGFDILGFKPIINRLVTYNQKTFESSVVWRGCTKDSLIIGIPIDDLELGVKPTLTEEVKKLTNKKTIEDTWETYHQKYKASKSKEQFYSDYMEDIIVKQNLLKMYSEKLAFTIAMLKMRGVNDFGVELKILTPSSSITKEFN